MKSFTLIELLIVIAIVVILMTATLVALNPFRQFAQANDANRMAGINAILNALSQRMADNRGCIGPIDPDGVWPTTDCPCPGDDVPTSTGTINGVPNIPNTYIGSGTGQYNLARLADPDGIPNSGDEALVPIYLAQIPIDPQKPAYYNSPTDYDSRFTFRCNPDTKRIEVCAPWMQLAEKTPQKRCVYR